MDGLKESPASTSSRSSHPMLGTLVVFLALVVLLQWSWRQASGTAVERFVIDTATVGTAARLINWVTPNLNVKALGTRIASPQGGINVLNGCEGTEVLVLFIPALLAYRLTWRTRLIGVLAGSVLIFVVNQLRLLGLFYSFLFDRALFASLHGFVAPLILIAITAVLFVGLIRWDRRWSVRSVGHSASHP